MRYPNLSEEKKLWKQGYKRVACLDEAGVGPLAGPVVAAAVAVNPKFEIRNSKQIRNSKFKYSKCVLSFSHLDFDIVLDFALRASNLKVRDSKKLSPKAREKIYRVLTKHPQIEWGIGRVSEKTIDKINIFEATKLAMIRAVKKMGGPPPRGEARPAHRLGGPPPRGEARPAHRLGGPPDFLILDGRIKLKLKIPQKSIVKADNKVFSCAAASILAKVTRDRIMRRYHQKYPQWRFDIHKGYPTKLHKAMIKKYDFCKIHRRSFNSGV